jgi:hypothetical protein
MTTIWLAGVFKEGDEGPWEVLGVFLTERRAVSACTKENHFIGPLPLNKRLPDRCTPWDGAYYPKERAREKKRRKK